MDFIEKMVERFLRLNRKMKRWQRAVSILGAVVVFASTYMLVLPAITLDKDTATTQAGIEVAANENEPSEDGTVYEAEPEDEEAVEEAAEDEEEASSVDSGSEEAVEEEEEAPAEEVTEAPAEEEAPAASEEETDAPEEAPAAGEDAEPENTEEAETAPEGLTEEAAAAATEEAAPEVEYITEQTELVYEGSDYKVFANFGAAAKLPVGVELQVEEITEDSDAYAAYYEKTLAEMQDKYDEYTKLSFAKFYDITFVKDGAEVEPSGDVKIRIEYEEAVEVDKDTNVDAIHFDDDTAEVIDSETDGSDKAVEAVEFKSDQFSVFGVVGSETLTGGIITADGRMYEVTVTYEVDAEIPKDSKLELVEFAKDSAEYLEAKAKVDAFKEANKSDDEPEFEDEEDINGLDALGIRIVDPEGNEVEPKDTVKVSIVMKSLPEGYEQAEQLLGSLAVHHLAEKDGSIEVEQVAGAAGDGSVLATADDKATVAFETDSFSTYTVSWNGNRSVIMHFVTDTDQDLSGVTYENINIDGSSAEMGTLLPNNGDVLDLTKFKVNGYTLSNVHIGTTNDLSVDGEQSNTIIANEVRRYNNWLQYRAFNNVDDDAGSRWINFGEGNTINDNTPTPQGNYPVTGNTHTYTQNGVTNIYLVYSLADVTMPGSESEDDPSGDDPDIGEIGKEKEVSSNGDGTYTLELSVIGQAQEQQQNPDVNVCFILDQSTSMNRNGRDWLQRSVDMIKNMVNELAKNNTGTNNDAVEFSLITFNHSARLRQNWTTSATTFANTIDNIGNTEQGTNWAEALNMAQSIDRGDKDPTYVIFITDGAPSRYWYKQHADYYSDGEGCFYGARDEARNLLRNGKYYFYGLFSFSTDTRGFLEQLVNYGYNNEDAADEYYANPTDADALEAKLEDILAQINLNFAYAGVTVDDGITDMTTVVFEDTSDETFEYEITYLNPNYDPNPDTQTADTKDEWIPIPQQPIENEDGTLTIPAQTYYVNEGGQQRAITTEEYTVTGADFSMDSSGKNKSVSWNIKQTNGDPYMLEQNWKYTFKCIMWPSQPSYDIIAALNNGLVNWGDNYTYVDSSGNTVTIPYSEYGDQIVQGTPYTLKTNTYAKVTYQKYKRKIVNGKVTYEALGDPTTVDIDYNSKMDLDESAIILKKDWETTLTEEYYDKIPSVDMYVLEDNPDASGFDKNDPTTYYLKVTLTAPDWEEKVAIAPGVWDGNVFRTTGHTYSVVEPDIAQIANLNHYEFVMNPVHPMLKGSTVDTILDMVDVYNCSQASEYRDMEYNEDTEETTYRVANILKGEIIVEKEVEVEDEYKNYVNEDQKFKYEIKLEKENGDPVYTIADVEYGKYENLSYEILDKNGNQVDSGKVLADGILKLEIDASQSIHILNVPSGTYYTVKEYNVQSDTVYDYKKVDYEARERTAAGSNSWNTIDSNTKDYSGTDDFLDTDGLNTSHASVEDDPTTITDKLWAYPNAENEVIFTNKYVGTGHVAIKIWDDQDDALGLRPKKITLQLKRRAVDASGSVVVDYAAYGLPTDIGIEVGNPPVSNVEVSADGNTWTYTWKGLPLKGVENDIVVTYEYDFEEIIVPNYLSVKEGNTITNTLYRKVKFIKIDMESTITADGSGDKIIPVEGAEFTIDIEDTHGNKTTLTLTSDANGILTDKSDPQNPQTEFLIPIKENAATLTETKYPTGYQMLKQPVLVSVRKVASGGVTYSYEYTSDPVLEEVDDKGMTVYVIRIRDSKGVELPFTGGPGTLIYTLSGMMLIFAAAMMYGFRMRRRERRLN